MPERSSRVREQGSASEREIRASQVEVLRLCDLVSTWNVPLESLGSGNITPDLFEKIKILAGGELDLDAQKTWKEIAKLLIPTLVEAVEPYQARVENSSQFPDLEAIRSCDRRAMELLPAKMFSAEKRVDIRMRMDTLSNAEALDPELLGDGVKSTNAPSRCWLTTETGEKIRAYIKSRLKEAAFKFIKVEKEGEDGVSWDLHQRVVRLSQDGEEEFDWVKVEEGSIVLDGSRPEMFRRFTSEEFQETVRNILAEQLGVSPEEVSYDSSGFNSRVGVLPGEMTVREWSSCMVDLLLGFEGVPLTVIRPEGGDVASFQEGVRGVDPHHEPRDLTQLDAARLFGTPPKWWGDVFPEEGSDEPSESSSEEGVSEREPVRSIARAGVFAYLMGDLDGTENNCKFDPVSKKVTQIDRGLCQGVLTGVPFDFEAPATRGNAKKGKFPCHENLRSVPLELMLKHGLKLDKKAHEHVKDLYARLDAGGAEREHLQNVFRVVFRSYGERMVQKQLTGFLTRLKDVAEHGRPTGLTKGWDYMNEVEDSYNELMAKIAKEKSGNKIAA